MSNDAVAGPGPRPGRITFQRLQQISIFLLTLALCVFSSIQVETFFTWGNLVDNLLTYAAPWGIVACGMTLVMIAGGFDLSVASTTAVCTVVLVLVLRALEPHGAAVAVPAALGATLLAGTLLGAVNGVLIAYVGVNPFVVTLSTMLIYRGVALILTGGGQAITVPLSLYGGFRWIFTGTVPIFPGSAHTVPVPILLFLAVFAIVYYLLRLTRFGHYVYAVGGNENASWLAGVNTSLVNAATYAICGTTCAVAAAIFMAQATTATSASFRGDELLVIAAVIVGGTPLGGGAGGVVATLNGLLLLNLIDNLLTQYEIGQEARQVIQGLIILVVVTLDVLVKRGQHKALVRPLVAAWRFLARRRC
jgi:ribose transport system permease protein